MLGRGMVAHPGLALAIAADDPQQRLPWAQVRAALPHFWQGVCQRVAARHRAGRLKQWLWSLRLAYPEAQEAFAALRLEHDPQRIALWLAEAPRP